MLVFNTTENEDLRPGYYYWFETSWLRIITDQDDAYRDILKNEEFAVNNNEQTLYLKDSKGNIVSVPLKDINILTTLENQGNGQYIYTAEDGSQTTIDVVGDVTNNFEEIITNEDVQEILNQYFNNALPLGNVTYVEENGSFVFKYLDEAGENQLIDISALVKSFETVTTITPEQVNGVNTGTYVYKNEALDEVTIDVVGDVTNNFEKIITNEDVQEILNQYFNNALPLGNVTYVEENGSFVFKYLDEAGENQLIDISALVKSFETVTTITPEQVNGVNTGTYVYKNEALDEVTIDVVGDVTNNFEEIITNEDVQEILNQYFNNALPLGNVTYVEENGSFVFKYLDEAGENQLIDISALVKSFETVTTITPEQVNGVNTGTYVYKNEALDEVTIDVVGDVTNNFEEIITNEDVQNNIYEIIETKGKALLSDESIKVTNGEKSLLNEVSIEIAKKGVDTEHLKDNAVLTSKIKDGAVSETKLWAGQGKNNFVAIVQNDGTVKYQELGTILQGEALSVDNSLKLEGDASASLLKGVKIQVSTNGIVTKHIENKGVTAEKIGSENMGNGAVLTANGIGGAVFTPLTEALIHAVNGDIVGDTEQTILVKGGENVLIGEQGKEVGIELNISGVKERHIADGAVTASKLNAENASEGSVAIVGTGGTVSYQPLTTDMLTEKGTIIPGETISAIQGADGAVLQNVILEVNDQSITASKLIAKEEEQGYVAIVGEQGRVNYQPLTAELLQNKGTITTDDIIVVSDNGINKVLEDVNLSIKEKSINTEQLADNAVKTAQIAELAVTNNKITSGNVGKGRVLLSDDQGRTVWGEMDKIYDSVAGNLLTDDIITIMPDQQGVTVTGDKALLKDIRLGIKEQSITNQQIAEQTIQINKLSSIGSDEGMVMVTNSEGGFTYVDRASIVQEAKDLQLEDGLRFVSGNGISAVLANTTVGIQDQGITTAKLQDRAVTVDKISSERAAMNAVLTADGYGAVNYQEINENIFSGKGENLLSDTSIKVTPENKALLQQTSIAVAEQGVDTKHLKDTAVTTTKISSKIGDELIGEGAFLVTNGQGSTTFSFMDEIALKSGKELKADTSISVVGGDHALLKQATIQIAPSGIQEQHLSDKSVTPQKINADGETKGLVLLTDGEGGASFETVTAAIADAGKTLYAGDGIEVIGGNQALLKDVSISVKDKGITNGKIADKTIQAIKIDADQADQGTVLTSLGDGEAKFLSLNSYGKQLDSDSSITVSTREGVLLAPASIKVSNAGITTEHLGEKTVTINKLSSIKEDGESVVANQILLTDGQGGYNYGKADQVISKANIVQGETISATSGAIGSVLKEVVLEVNNLSIDTKHLKNNAIITEKIANDAVTYAKLRAASVYGTVVKDKGVTAAKISSQQAIDGELLVADGDGGATFRQVAFDGVDYSKEEQIKDIKWLDTDKKVAQRVFEIELTQPENKITLDGDFASIILDARLINQTTNSSTRDLIKKEVVNGKTVLTLGTPGTVTVKHPKGKYYLILEYVKK